MRISLEDCPWPTMNGALRRETRFDFVRALMNKRRGDDQGCSDRHAVAVAWSLAFPQRWARSTTG